MLGSGVFVLPGLAVGMTGGSAFLAYATVALCVLPAALAKAELASALPQSGGAYVFINKAFGPLTGTIMGLGLWASLLLKSAFALVGFSAYLRVLNETISETALALGLLVIITCLNLAGIKKVSQFQTVVVFISLSGLALLMSFSLPAVHARNFQPLFLNGAMGFSETVAFVFVSYAGVTKVSAIAGEVRNPGKNLPRGILLSLALITPLYCLIVFTLNGVLGVDRLKTNIRPIYSLATETMGPTAGLVAALVAILTMTSMANAGLLASSRFPFAMSRDGLLPPLFGIVHQRYLTPTACIFITAAAMGITISTLDIARIVKLASACMILAFAANNVALIVLRSSKSQWYKPEYHSPLFPALPIVGALVCGVLLVAMGEMALLAIAAISISGSLLYLFYGRKRTRDRGVLGKLGLRGDLLMPYTDPARAGNTLVSPKTTTIVALIGKEHASIEMLTLMGTALDGRKQVEVIHITEVPDQMALDEMLEEEPWVNSMRRRVLGMRELTHLNVQFRAMVSHDRVASLHDLSTRMSSDWLVMSWKSHHFFNPLGWLYNHLPSDLALFKDAHIRYIRRLLVLADPRFPEIVLTEAAQNLAAYFRASITFVTYLPLDAPASDTKQTRLYLDYVQKLCDISTKTLLLRGDSRLDTLAEATESYDLFVIGSRPHNKLSNIFFQTHEDRLVEHSICSTLLLKSPRAEARVLQDNSPSNLSEHIAPEIVKLGELATTKEALFKMCAEHFMEEVACAVTDEDILFALTSRERAQNTGVCHGVAMPHATLPELTESYLLIEVLKDPIDYDSSDGQPVDIIISTIGPPQHRQIQLLLLAAFSKHILNTELLTSLRSAKSIDEVMWLIQPVLEDRPQSQPQ